MALQRPIALTMALQRPMDGTPQARHRHPRSRRHRPRPRRSALARRAQTSSCISTCMRVGPMAGCSFPHTSRASSSESCSAWPTSTAGPKLRQAAALHLRRRRAVRMTGSARPAICLRGRCPQLRASCAPAARPAEGTRSGTCASAGKRRPLTSAIPPASPHRMPITRRMSS